MYNIISGLEQYRFEFVVHKYIIKLIKISEREEYSLRCYVLILEDIFSNFFFVNFNLQGICYFCK